MFVNHVVQLYTGDTEHTYLALKRYNKAKARTFPGADISSDQDVVLVLYLHRSEPLTPCALFLLALYIPRGASMHTWGTICPCFVITP